MIKQPALFGDGDPVVAAVSSPPYWSHVNPYGPFRLDIERRLDLDRGPAGGPNGRAPAS